MRAECKINFPGGGGWGKWVAGLVENKANSARPAELELAASWGWAELGENAKFCTVPFAPISYYLDQANINEAWNTTTVHFSDDQSRLSTLCSQT